ncbi:MAG: hypothetical protein B6I28_04185 [Fusobacteriia bacterium 4572_132]|nr:MAG: hypothetical protein B6I28_04185 [Fusobacteriia bacterium 4572_132]
MKLAVVSTGKELGSKIDERFGRGDAFIVVDTETMEFEWVDNEAKNAGGGAGPQAVRILAKTGAEAVVLNQHLGPKAATTLESFDIKAYLRGDAVTVEEAVNLFKEGKLESIKDSNVEEHSGMKK